MYKTLALSAFLLTLAGCSINGNYTDANEPNAAKLRFIAQTDNANLAYFDAQNCDGMQTGLLNNYLTRNTERRANMVVPPPVEAKAYYEIKLKPEHEAYFRAHTGGNSGMCDVGFSLIPKANSEYEANFRIQDRKCVLTLMELKSVNGTAIRTLAPLKLDPPKACQGANRLFPKQPEPLPDTPQRLELISKIVKSNTPTATEDTSEKKESIEDLIKDHKAKLDISLPEDYWARYRDNLIKFKSEMAAVGAETLKNYQEEVSSRLRALDDSKLKAIADVSENPVDNKTADYMKNKMKSAYLRAEAYAKAGIISRQLGRMAELDAEYHVCDKSKHCWKPS